MPYYLGISRCCQTQVTLTHFTTPYEPWFKYALPPLSNGPQTRNAYSSPWRKGGLQQRRPSTKLTPLFRSPQHWALKEASKGHRQQNPGHPRTAQNQNPSQQKDVRPHAGQPKPKKITPNQEGKDFKAAGRPSGKALMAIGRRPGVVLAMPRETWRGLVEGDVLFRGRIESQTP